jgi:hypothetical protein
MSGGEVQACALAAWNACYYDNGGSLSAEEYLALNANAAQCKTIESSSGKTQLQIYRLYSGSIIAYVLKAPQGSQLQQCGRSRYRIDGGIGEIKEFDSNKVVMRSNDNSIFVVYPDLSAIELLSGSKKPYSTQSVSDLLGSSDNKTFTMVMSNGQHEVYDNDRLNKKKEKNETRPVDVDNVEIGTNAFGF